MMRPLRTIGLTFITVILTVAVTLWAQTRVTYINGVPYKFPSALGSVGTFLKINATDGTLTWETPSTPEGLWAGSGVWSTAACPTGWTELAAAANKFIRVSTTAGSTGGSDTHGHTMSGVTGSNGVTITGSTASGDANHTHGYSGSGTTGTPSATNIQAEGSEVSSFTYPNPSHTHNFSWSGTSVGASGNAAHSHGAGTLAGSSHGHSTGSLAAASASGVPAYYTLRLCVKD